MRRKPEDREAYLDRLGEDLEPGGREPAPPPLRIVQQFVNTYNHELPPERDRLRDPEAATRWLTEHSLLAAGDRLSTEDTRRLREARELLRALVGTQARQAQPMEAMGDFDLEVTMNLRLREGSGLALEPSDSGLERAIGILTAIVHEALIDGSWQRMKTCRQCSWLFFDHSRNRSGNWCAMAVCGSRAKNRAYRRRGGSNRRH